MAPTHFFLHMHIVFKVIQSLAGGFCPMLELHRNGSARSLRSRLVFDTNGRVLYYLGMEKTEVMYSPSLDLYEEKAILSFYITLDNEHRFSSLCPLYTKQKKMFFLYCSVCWIEGDTFSLFSSIYEEEKLSLSLSLPRSWGCILDIWMVASTSS